MADGIPVLKLRVTDVAAIRNDKIAGTELGVRVTMQPENGEHVYCGAARFFFTVDDEMTAQTILERWTAFCEGKAPQPIYEVPVMPGDVEVVW